jgi:hypothetical protein
MLRVGVVPEPALEHLSVGFDSVSGLCEVRLDDLQSGRPLKPLFVLGEWETGKSHCLAFIRHKARQLGIGSSSVLLNARSTAINYPQRFYAVLVENLRWKSEGLGLREVLSQNLSHDQPRRRVTEFSESPAAGDLSHQLKFLADTYGEECPLFCDGEWAWSGLLGADLGWADYAYKREQAMARVQVIARLSRRLGLSGVVATFDEAETIDQLWNIRSRFVAYDVLGRLCSMRALWPVFGITDRFVRVIDDDLKRYGTDALIASDYARRFLKLWSVKGYDVIEPPKIGTTEGHELVEKVVRVYAKAHSLGGVDGAFAKRCLDEWTRNPSRNPRRLIRLTVHRLDLCRSMF